MVKLGSGDRSDDKNSDSSSGGSCYDGYGGSGSCCGKGRMKQSKSESVWEELVLNFKVRREVKGGWRGGNKQGGGGGGQEDGGGNETGWRQGKERKRDGGEENNLDLQWCGAYPYSLLSPLPRLVKCVPLPQASSLNTQRVMYFYGYCLSFSSP